MILIGICGKARSGKDEAARQLAESLKLTHESFGAPLKHMLTAAFGDHFFSGDRELICPEAGVSYRTLMQTLGTEWGRGINPNLWVNLANKRWEQVKQRVKDNTQSLYGGAWQGSVFSDVRFDSEAEWILSQGGVLVEIQRTNRPMISGVEGHASEAGISASLTRYIVYNDRDLGFFRGVIDELARCITLGR